MARLEFYLTQPLTEAVGWALLHSLWQGAFVALLFAVGLTLLRGRNPQLHYLLGCAALVLLIALPVVTGVMLYDPDVQTRAALPDLEPTVGVASAEHVAPLQGEVTAPAILAAPSASFLPEHFTARLMITLQTSTPWLAAVWLVAVVLLLLRLLGQALYVHRFRARHRTHADVVWQARARALALRLGIRSVWQVVQSDRVESPLTFGVLRPLIVLPTSAITGMPAVQLEAILAHELAHIKRHDFVVNLVQCVVETLLFYHPAVWWVSNAVRRAREECCDDVAVSVCGDAKLYARALTNLETLRQHRPALALAATDMPLLARVRRLLGLAEARPFPPLATTILLLIMLALGTGLGVAGQTSAAQKPPTASPTTLAVPKQGSSIKGTVMWNDERLANIKVELQEDTGFGLWGTPGVLQTTETNAQGEYNFENVPPGDYMVWALGEEEGYISVGYPAAAYAETSGYYVLRLDKPIEVIGPTGTSGTSLTPTLRWKPVPGAARYEVSLDDITPPETLTTTRLSYQTDKPNLKIAEPLKRNRFYGWSVTAYTEDDTQIATDYEGPIFSTGRRGTLRPVELRGIGASTVLSADWQQTSPGVFRYVNDEGERGSLTFEKHSRTDLEAGLGSEALTELKRATQRYAGRDWGSVPLKNGSLQLVTMQGDTVYLITAKGLEFEEPTRLTMELLGVVVPTIVRNFEITEQR